MKFNELFQKTKEISDNFKTIDEKQLKVFPEMLKIIRLSMNMSISEFSNQFHMSQESRFERGITKPSNKTIIRFIKEFDKNKNKCVFDSQILQKRNSLFEEKHLGGISVGKKTLFRRHDNRTMQLSMKGARKGGIATVSTYGQNHMAGLAKKIQRGRLNNSGFRSMSEMLVGRALKELGIEYEYEVPLEGYLPDFKIGNTLVEVMCTSTPEYWRKQAIKIAKLSRQYKMIIITNKPEKLLKHQHNVVVIKFSKYYNVLMGRVEEKLK